jgi:uncharacterized protein (TIGR02302 family)
MTLSSDSIASRPGFDRTQVPVGLARWALIWERVWSRLWPASGILGALLAAALGGLFEPLPWIAHAFLIAVAATFAGLTLERTFRDFRMPGWDDAARRIERDSGLSDRPITEGHDRLAAGRGDSWAEALWRETLRRRLAAARNLKVAWPAPRLAERDPRALRYLVLLLVAAAAIVANTSWRERLAHAFLASENTSGLASGLDAWIDPPAYTGLAPLYLSPAQTGEIRVPAGSQLNIRVHGADYSPIVSFGASPKSGGEVTGRNGEYSSTAILVQDGSVRVRASGRTLGSWDLVVLADALPSIKLDGKISKTDRGALKIPFEAGDDYGVMSVKAVIKPIGRAGAPLAVELALPALAAKHVKQIAFQDFTAHPYAGLNVALTLEARDGAGQIARSAAVTVKLPARVFTNPLARALVEQRRDLASDNNSKPHVTAALDALTIAPDLFYAEKKDKDVYTALNSALAMVGQAKNAADYSRVEDLLWQTALALEQGGLLNAAQELRRLQRTLTEALANGAPQDVIDALLQRYMDAMQRYMQLLAQNPQATPPGPPPPDAKSLSMKDLEALLKLIQQMAQSGNREDAARALAFLQSLIENMRLSGSGAGGDTPEDRAMSDAIKRLGDLMGQQRNLLDKTYRQQQGMGDPKDGGSKGLAQKQGDIRNQLDKVLKGLNGQGTGKDKLNKAGHEMGSAQNQLGGNDTDSAVNSENRALEQMRSAADEMAKKLMERMGQKGNEDPMGRIQGNRGATFGDGVKVPGESEMQRARRILEELRRRAAERGRPQEELDYIDRLLKQF